MKKILSNLIKRFFPTPPHAQHVKDEVSDTRAGTPEAIQEDDKGLSETSQVLSGLKYIEPSKSPHKLARERELKEKFGN